MIQFEIHEVNKRYLSIKMVDLLSVFENLNDIKWAVLWIYGLYGNQHTLDKEKSINKNKTPLFVSTKQLIELENNYGQLIEILIVGDEDSENLRTYDNDIDMKNNCSVIIELIDGSFWSVMTDEKYITDSFHDFPGYIRVK